jgi:hypothetical protein
MMKLATPDADPLSIPELRDLTLFFCGVKALAEFDAKLNQWATDATVLYHTRDGKEFVLYLTPENKDNTLLPSSHKDCDNPMAMVVHTRMNIDGKLTIFKVFQQDHLERLTVLRKKSELELKSQYATGALVQWSLDEKSGVKTRVDVIFTEEDAKELQRLSKALADEVLPMDMATPVKLQWRLAQLEGSLFAKDECAYFNVLNISALIYKARMMQNLPDLEVKEYGHNLELEVMSLKGDPKKCAEIMALIKNNLEKGVETPQDVLYALKAATPKRVSGNLVRANLEGAVLPEVTALICEALALYPERVAALGDRSDVEKLATIADSLIAEKLAEEGVPEKLKVEA